MEHREGVIYRDEDRGKGPFVLRVSGTSDFVTGIKTGYYSRFGSPAEAVEVQAGWGNPAALSFQTMDKAIAAAEEAFRIEGCYLSVETK